MKQASKDCPRCDTALPLEAFNRDKSRKGGLSCWCRGCQAEAQKAFRALRMADPEYRAACVAQTVAWNAANPEVAERTKRRSHLKRLYGMTLERYEELHESQGGLCAICDKPEKGGRWLSVDHNHETGQVRQLLCSQCNLGIGAVGESPEWFDRAKAYLELWSK